MGTNIGARWRLAYALTVAKDLQSALQGVCDRLEIAGSLRRRKDTVGDIELIAIPKVEMRVAEPAARQISMFTGMDPIMEAVDLLELKLGSLIEGGILAKRGGYGPKNKFLVHIPTSVVVDLFTTSPSHWGMTMFVRTGDAAFVREAMARFIRLGHAGHAYGGITLHADTSDRVEIDCPDEEAVFGVLGVPYISPERRCEGALRAVEAF